MSTVVMIRGDVRHHNTIKSWCLDQFGIDCRNLEVGKWYSPRLGMPMSGNALFVPVQNTYVFRDEADAVMFKLRWA